MPYTSVIKEARKTRNESIFKSLHSLIDIAISSIEFIG
jgi:hypothetical protein